MYLMLNILEIIVISYLGASVLYIFYFSLRGKLYKYIDCPQSINYNKIVVFIPAYKEDKVILTVAKEAIKQHYPADEYDVVIISDSIDADIVLQLKELPIKLVEVSFEKSTKVKALQQGVSSVGHGYQMAVILDADNVMEKNFLNKMNNAYNASNLSIQGKRTAKNEDTGIAVLDGISELINNHIFRLGYNASNLSSSIIGSGVAFDYSIFKEVIMTMDSVGGFDRELQVLILKKGIKTLYVPTAIVLDEKVQNSMDLQNQRRRWVSSQFIYLKKYFREGMSALFRGDFDFFNSAVLSNLLLPRVLLIGFLFFVCIIYFFLPKYFLIHPAIWILLFSACLCALIMPIPFSFYNKKNLLSLLLLPSAFFSIFKSLMTSRGANKNFIHTPHGQTKSGKR